LPKGQAEIQFFEALNTPDGRGTYVRGFWWAKMGEGREKVGMSVTL